MICKLDLELTISFHLILKIIFSQRHSAKDNLYHVHLYYPIGYLQLIATQF